MSNKLPAYKANPKNIIGSRICPQCGSSFLVARKYPDQVFCKSSCGLKAKNPPDHNAKVARESAVKRGNSQRGRGKGKTYRKLNGRHEHRVRAEEKLGRPLRPGEIVHHRDEDKRNNGFDNLAPLPSQSEHARLHFTGTKQSPEHILKRVESRRKTMRLK